MLQNPPAAAGVSGLTPLDVLVLHSVLHRSRPKTLADICLVLNIEDTYIVSYAVKKLERIGLVASERAQKEKRITITPYGTEVCQKYKEVREEVLVHAVMSTGIDPENLSQLAALMRNLSGLYDQAARVGASL